MQEIRKEIRKEKRKKERKKKGERRKKKGSVVTTIDSLNYKTLSFFFFLSFSLFLSAITRKLWLRVEEEPSLWTYEVDII